MKPRVTAEMAKPAEIASLFHPNCPESGLTKTEKVYTK
jgi:hypothetical protein